MSRVAKKPITLPKGVEFNNADRHADASRARRARCRMAKPAGVERQASKTATSQLSAGNSGRRSPMTGTIRAILANMVKGVSEGFERKLELVGVGYRAAMQGKDLNLCAGLLAPGAVQDARKASPSPPRPRPRSWSPAPTSSASVKSPPRSARYRPPEPYKGKGVKYSGEKIIIRKEAKKA